MDNLDIQMDAIEWDRNVGHVLPAFGCLIFPFSMLRRAYESYATSGMAGIRVFSFFFIILMILSLGFVRYGFRRLRLANHAEKYIRRLKANEDGSVLYFDMSPVINEHNSTKFWSKDIDKIKRDYLDIIQRGYLRNAVAVEEGYGAILINKSTKQWSKDIYLNRDKWDKKDEEAKKASIACLFFLLVFVLGVLLQEPDEYPRFMPLFIVPSFLLIILRYLQVFLGRERLRRANRYGQEMEKSGTGIISIHDLAERTGFHVFIVKKDIKWLYSHGILRGCDLVLDGEPTIILDDVVNGKAIFDACECPGCLHTTKVRAGHVAKCSYCSRLLEAPIILAN